MGMDGRVRKGRGRAAANVIKGQNTGPNNEAFPILAETSSHWNSKIRVVAETILANAQRGSATITCRL